LFILFPTVHRKTNVLVNLCWDNKYSDSDMHCAHEDETRIDESAQMVTRKY